jgi:large subunit ribosomal protein L17
MRHRSRNRILGRTAPRRKQLLQSLTSALLQHGAIVTTEAKAKELRSYFEPLVTQAKGEMSLHRRRNLLRRLLHKDDLLALLEVASAHKKRPGGYVQLTRLPKSRHDDAQLVNVRIVEHHEEQQHT